jgi:murein DD-endopeptidase MepM/ murein hydrolase activator NlpD
MKEGFVLEVLRQGTAVCRLQFRKRHFAVLGVLLVAVCAGLFALHQHQLRAASVAVQRLQAQRFEQQRLLDEMERQTQALQKQNLDSQRSIERIERTLGSVRTRTSAKVSQRRVALPVGLGRESALDARLASLQRASANTRAQAERLARRVLNLSRLASMARARTLAAIPSLNPVGGAVNAAFGWRTDPWPEFHKGLDLAADYGHPVLAAASGTVASAGWEGGFGIKVDLDHGNGYHTWYCHLSRLTVAAGQRVAKGQHIAFVGSTGESTGPHLHYQVMHDGVAIDPMPYLNGVPKNLLATLPARPDVH